MHEQMRIPKIPAAKPRKKRGRRLIFFLFVFFVAVLVVLFFRSSISRITEIDVSGNEIVSAEQIEQASEITLGDHFFGVSTKEITDRINKMRMIESTEVSKHFPGKLSIVVREQPKVGFQIAEDGRQEYVLADGSIVPIQGLSIMLDKPILSGWEDADPNKVNLAKTMSTISPHLFYEVSEIRPYPSESYPDRIKLYTRTGIEVVTTIEYLPDKIQYLSAYITNLKDNNIANGVLSLLEVDSYHLLNGELVKPEDEVKEKEKEK